jgi:hypothetical protein
VFNTAKVLLGSLLLFSWAQAQWHHYVVDSLAENQLPRLVMQGRIPHIAFYTDAGLEYAVWDSGSWTRDTVDIAETFHNGNPALVFDRDSNPHVAWFKGTPWYAYWDGDEWQREEIDADSGGDYISLVLDSIGQPCAAYARRRGLFNYMLKFAHRDSQGWHPALLDSSGGADCVLGIDTLGRFCIAHCESWSDAALFYHTQTDTGWVKQTVVPEHASQCKMVLDQGGDPHISYYWAGGGAYDLRFAERVAGEWRHDIIDPGQQTSKRGWDNWIVRDRSGRYHLSYHAHNELQVRYACGTYGNWQVEVVNTVGGWNLGSSIDLDELGRPCMAYVNENQSDRLYLSTRYDLTGIISGPEPRPRTAESRIPAIVRGSIRLDSSQPALLVDALGCTVTALRPGINDLSRVAPGVYFVLPEARGSARVVVQR